MVGKRQRSEVENVARAFLDIEADVSDDEFGSNDGFHDDDEESG